MNNEGKGKVRVLVGVTGSVATIKIKQLVQELRPWAHIKLVATNSSKHFFNPSELEDVEVYGDDSDWHGWSKKGDPVLHIELRRWAQAFVIAPLSANTLAKMAVGMSDNLLMCIYRAWDFQKPLIVAPAMNTFMYESLFTKRHLSTLKSLGVEVVPVVSKKLACGDVGQGAMAETKDIVNYVYKRMFTNSQSSSWLKPIFCGLVLTIVIVKVMVHKQQ